jgi:hypothetical protein
MEFRFRRSWGLIPGVRLNLGKKSGSLSFGFRGFHYTVGTQGKRVTAGIPGTGLFWTKKITSSAGTAPSPQAQIPQSQAPQAPIPQAPVPQPKFPISGGIARPVTPPPPPWVGGIQSPPSGKTRIFLPAWVAYAALSVIAITALCVAAAMLGGRIAIPTIKSQTGQSSPVALFQQWSRVQT